MHSNLVRLRSAFFIVATVLTTAAMVGLLVHHHPQDTFQRGKQDSSSRPEGKTEQSLTTLRDSHSAVQSYGQLPMAFEVNSGQTDPKVKFISRGPGYAVFLISSGPVFSLTKSGSGSLQT